MLNYFASSAHNLSANSSDGRVKSQRSPTLSQDYNETSYILSGIYAAPLSVVLDPFGYWRAMITVLGGSTMRLMLQRNDKVHPMDPSSLISCTQSIRVESKKGVVAIVPMMDSAWWTTYWNTFELKWKLQDVDAGDRHPPGSVGGMRLWFKIVFSTQSAVDQSHYIPPMSNLDERLSRLEKVFDRVQKAHESRLPLAVEDATSSSPSSALSTPTPLSSGPTLSSSSLFSSSSDKLAKTLKEYEQLQLDLNKFKHQEAATKETLTTLMRDLVEGGEDSVRFHFSSVDCGVPGSDQQSTKAAEEKAVFRKPLVASRKVLCTYESFRNMFHKYEQIEGKAVSEVNILGFKRDIFFNMLFYMYTGNVDTGFLQGVSLQNGKGDEIEDAKVTVKNDTNRDYPGRVETSNSSNNNNYKVLIRRPSSPSPDATASTSVDPTMTGALSRWQELFVLSDCFGVESLRQRCFDELVANLAISTVVDDLFNLGVCFEDLKVRMLNYIEEHHEEIFLPFKTSPLTPYMMKHECRPLITEIVERGSKAKVNNTINGISINNDENSGAAKARVALLRNSIPSV